MKAASAKVRAALSCPVEDDDDVGGGEWRYYVDLPTKNMHKNHFTSDIPEV